MCVGFFRLHGCLVDVFFFFGCFAFSCLLCLKLTCFCACVFLTSALKTSSVIVFSRLVNLASCGWIVHLCVACLCQFFLRSLFLFELRSANHYSFTSFTLSLGLHTLEARSRGISVFSIVVWMCCLFFIC